MRRVEIFWKLLSNEKKAELFNVIDEPVPDNDNALAILSLPFVIANNPTDVVDSMLNSIKLPKSTPTFVWKIHEILYDD